MDRIKQIVRKVLMEETEHVSLSQLMVQFTCSSGEEVTIATGFAALPNVVVVFTIDQKDNLNVTTTPIEEGLKYFVEKLRSMEPKMDEKLYDATIYISDVNWKLGGLPFKIGHIEDRVGQSFDITGKYIQIKEIEDGEMNEMEHETLFEFSGDLLNGSKFLRKKMENLMKIYGKGTIPGYTYTIKDYNPHIKKDNLGEVDPDGRISCKLVAQITAYISEPGSTVNLLLRDKLRPIFLKAGIHFTTGYREDRTGVEYVPVTP